ncbi:MAG: histidine phosphatase family protein [Bacteroidota bacterium]
MKTVYLMRHAKSTWEFPELKDEERPLIEKGIRRTKKIIRFLNIKNVKPDIIISSHAVRAQETAKLMAEGLDCPLNEIVIDEKVYESNIENLFNIVYGIPNDKNTLIMIGHNPTITNFANYFLTEYVDYMPTSAVVCVEFDTDKWNEIVSVKKQTRFIIYPKMLK